MNGEENQWESMSNHPVRESIRRGEQEKETAAGSEKREKARDEETDNKWDDAPHDGLPQASAATWNYTTKDRWGGRLFTEASGLADYPVGKIPYPIGCGETAQ